MNLLAKIFYRTVAKFSCAFRGILKGISYDRSILIQVFLALISVIFFSIIKITATQWLFVTSAIFVVLITEFLNSAVEDVCDLLIDHYNLHVKEIKDISAAAVLLAATYAVIIAVVVIYGRFG